MPLWTYPKPLTTNRPVPRVIILEDRVPHWPHASAYGKLDRCRHTLAPRATMPVYVFTFQQNRTSWNGRSVSSLRAVTYGWKISRLPETETPS